MAVYVEVDIHEVANELDRLMSQPTTKTLFALESTLATTYAATELAVPVDTGSLRGSGKISSSVGPARWEGELSYGGASPGFPNDPVGYAWFVLGGHQIVAWGRRSNRGKQYQESDDYMAPWSFGESGFEQAVMSALRDDM